MTDLSATSVNKLSDKIFDRIFWYQRNIKNPVWNFLRDTRDHWHRIQGNRYMHDKR